MTLPWLGDADATVWHGDVRAMLAEVPDASVQCVVTSPPYWGLRDYGIEGQIGLEETPDGYIAAMTDVFREVRRVLREDGCCWLNLGDSYANDGKWGGHTGGKHAQALHCSPIGRNKRYTGLKPKDLVGIPWAAAFALRDDGWYLRSDVVEEVELYCPCGCGYVLEERIWRHSPDREVIWLKPNPMPESIKDRPTKAHEYVFLLTKNERYYWDEENAKEQTTGGAKPRGHGVGPKARAMGQSRESRQNASFSAAVTGIVTRRNMRSVWDITTRPYPGGHFATFPPELPRRCIRASTPEGGCCSVCRCPYRRLVEKGEPLAEQMAACGADSTGGYHGQATKAYGPRRCPERQRRQAAHPGGHGRAAHGGVAAAVPVPRQRAGAVACAGPVRGERHDAGCGDRRGPARAGAGTQCRVRVHGAGAYRSVTQPREAISVSRRAEPLVIGAPRRCTLCGEEKPATADYFPIRPGRGVTACRMCERKAGKARRDADGGLTIPRSL